MPASPSPKRKPCPVEARRHLAEIAPPAPAPSLPEGWQPGGDYSSFAAGFRQAIGAHVARIGRGGYEICDGCGINFDPYTSGNPTLCHGCAGMVLHEHVTTQSC